jgi:tRNA A37 threonylcarbamoyladenosine biosynthesis protein TsaE
MRGENVSDDRARDLDETRRLLYGALAAGRTKRWELVGTLTNALVHHSGIESDPYVLIGQLVEVVEADMYHVDTDPRGECVRGLLDRLPAG